MRVLQLISSNSFGGAERVVCELAKQLSINSINCTIGIMGASHRLFEEFAGKFNSVQVKLVPFSCQSPVSYRCIRQLADYMDGSDIEIIHSHGYKSDIYAFASTLITKKKVIRVATNHNWLLNTTAEKIYKKLDLAVLNFFEGTVAVSPLLIDEMKTAGIGKKRLHRIDNGIDVSSLSSVSKEQSRILLQLDSSEFIVGCVASLTPEKAHNSLLHTFHRYAAELQKLKLVLVGDGPLRAELEELADTLGLRDKVTFLGHRADVNMLYAAFDVFVLVSVKEGLPMVLLEAMASGLPVVVTPVGAIPQVITDGVQGLLVQPGDHTAISSALLTLASNPELRSQMGHAAYTTVLEKYSSKRMAEDYEMLYQKLLGTS